MENPTNLPDDFFESLAKSLTPEQLSSFIATQPKKSDKPMIPFPEDEGLDGAIFGYTEDGRFVIYDEDGNEIKNDETKNPE